MVNGIDHGVYLLIKSRKAERSSQANRMEAELRSADPTTLPWVDIMITTYSEDWKILEKTIEGAKNIDYPNKNLGVWMILEGTGLKSAAIKKASATSHVRTIAARRRAIKTTDCVTQLPLHSAIGCPVRPDAGNTHPDDWIFYRPEDRHRSDSAVVS